jgi:molybdopterin converting factor subunit 1
MDQVDVKVLLFASAKELAGQSEAIVRIQSIISYEELKNKICEEFNLENIRNNFILAVNQDFVESGLVELKNNDELAVIPPLSGG